MRTKTCAAGLTSLCLLLLAGCASAPPSAAPTLIVTGCPAVTPCVLPATAPGSNGALLQDADTLELAWAECAAKVDAVIAAQPKEAAR